LRFLWNLYGNTTELIAQATPRLSGGSRRAVIATLAGTHYDKKDLGCLYSHLLELGFPEP